VLTVAKVTARVAAGYANYLEGKTAAGELGDYYLRDGERVEAPGRWVTGASSVRCEHGTVGGEVLRELMAVRHPRTGDALRAVGASGEAVAALDATFSAPKSVSAMWALADPQLRQAIEQAHEQAIDRAVGYAVGQVAMTRRRLDRHSVVHERPADLVATSWRHTTARAVDGQAPDPQLHSHVLLHAAVRRDGRLVAIDSRAWLNHRREVGAAYRTELAHRLSRLGFEVMRGTGRGGRYFEVAGVPQELLDRWSSRSRQVQQAIEARLASKATAGEGSRLTPAEQRMTVLRSRAGKQPITTADLDRDWRKTGQQAGLGDRAVERLLQAGRAALEAVEVGELVSGLTEFDATFTDREARAVALERSAGVPVAQALQTLDRARTEGEVLALADGRATTGRHRRMENNVLASSARLAGHPTPQIETAATRRAAETVDRRLAERGGRLSAEQREALVLATGDRRVVMIEGQAGTGKSTVLQAVALAHHTDGRQVIVTSTAAAAAERLAGDLREVGVPAAAYSTAALRHAVTSGALELDGATTVIHDEAALASTREQHQLLGMVEEADARLVIVGDPRQSKPVGAGGLWTRIEHQLTDRDARVELTENLRAKDPKDRRDQRLFRDGEHEQALRGYADRHRVRVAGDQAATEDGALWAAHFDRQAGRRPLVLAQTSNDHLDELNARAQAIRHQHGQLGTDSLTVPGRPYRLHPGDEVQIRHTINLPSHGQLRNGTPATIAAIDQADESARLRLGDEREVTLDRETLDRADVRLAYVQHPFPAQGATSDTAHLIVAEHATREGSYVALTRARQSTHIHVSWEQLTAESELQPISRLAELLSRTDPDLPSIATPLAHEQQVERQPDQPDHEAQRPWLSVLGDRPAEEPQRELWDQAANLIQAYRDRHGIGPEEPSPLGPQPAAGSFSHRLDRRQTAAQLTQTLRDLDRTDEARRLLEPARLERDDDLGWEL
jgi:conjugative relaxase-like TrwC/TraI family protein